ncbi:hypothetical protein LSM04_007879 [Trypanosoma melophagium]|uniref:uncharacterized protein n=1 Tax=Trypanosoma melophagium TaxID=715481 RepID=UPI00351A26CD|nr:hypothetical protein LSM04_007879 [Trypanosoma melophagium]
MQLNSSESFFKSAKFRRGVLDNAEQITDTDATRRENTENEKNAYADNAQPLFIPIGEVVGAVAAKELQPPVLKNCEWRTYPKVPYYAVIQGLQLSINVAGPSEDIDNDLNSATLLNSLPALQSLLQDAATKHGCIFYLSSLKGSFNTLLYPLHTGMNNTTASVPTSSPTATAELDYGLYLQALHDGFRRFTELRDECCRVSSSLSPLSSDLCTHHIFLVRIIDHLRLKDVIGLLAVENARLCLCLTASSKVTQLYFTQRAQDIGIELEWIHGSTLLSEPLSLSITDVNPVFALWDIFANMPLHTTLYETSGNNAAWTLGNSTADQFLRQVNVTILSSLQFFGSVSYTPVLRLCEVGQMGTGGKRLLWSLVGATRVVLPQFLAGIVSALVERSPVDCFELRFAYDSGGAVAGTAAAVGIYAADDARRGVRYVTGPRHGVVQQKSSVSSSVSTAVFRAFSRLSAEAWLSDGDRHYYALFLDDDPVPLECEFVVDSLRYSRRLGKPFLQMNGKQEQKIQHQLFLQPSRWGCCFQVVNHVEQVLVDDEE